MGQFAHVPRGVLAHSTHVKGIGTFENGVERPRITVTLATGIPEAECREVNLGYRDRRGIDADDWRDREDEGCLVPKAGETLYRLQRSDPLARHKKRRRNERRVEDPPRVARSTFVSLGALVHRLDPGIIPFRKAHSLRHPRQRRRVQRRRQPVRLLPPEHRHRQRDGRLPDRRPDRRARARHGREAVLQALQAQRRQRPQHGAVYSDRGHGVRAPVVFYNRANEAAAQLKPGDFDWKHDLRAAACAGSTAAASSRRCRRPPAS